MDSGLGSKQKYYYEIPLKEVLDNKVLKVQLKDLERSTILDGGKTTLSVFDQYMFRQSTLGNDELQEPFEMELVIANDIINLPIIDTATKLTKLKL